MPLSDRLVIKSSDKEIPVVDFSPHIFGKAVPQEIKETGVFQVSDVILEQKGLKEKRAREEQDRIEARVQEELEKVRSLAFDEGFESGRQEGAQAALLDAKRAMSELQEEMSKVVEDLLRLKSTMLKEAERDVMSYVKLAIESLFYKVIEVDDEALMGVLSECLRAVEEESDVLILFAESDKPAVEKWLPAFIEKNQQLQQSLRFQFDSEIEPGGLKLVINGGEIDGTVRTRWERFSSNFESLLPAHRKSFSIASESA